MTREFNRVIKRIVDWENKRRRGETLDQLADQVSHQWEKSTAYTNLIIAVGYAGFFATWSTLGVGDHPRSHAMAGLLVLLSLIVFILWEVFKMTLVGHFMQMIVPQLDADPHRVHEAIERIKKMRTNMNLWFARLWLPVLVLTLVLGMSGTTILVFLFVMRLLNPLAIACPG